MTCGLTVVCPKCQGMAQILGFIESAADYRTDPECPAALAHHSVCSTEDLKMESIRLSSSSVIVSGGQR